MNQRMKYLQNHPYKITQGADGRWSTYLPEKQLDGTTVRRNVKKRTREELEDAIVAYYKEDAKNPRIDQVFREWNDRRLQLEKVSMATYDRDNRYYNRHYKELGKRRIKSLREGEIVEFLEEQISKYELSAKAFSGLLGVTKGFLKYAKRRGLVTFSITETIADMDLTDASFHKQIRREESEVFSEAETSIVMNYLADHPDIWNLGILLSFVTGLRAGELAAIKREDLGEYYLNVMRTETSYHDPKTKKVHYEVKDTPKTKAGIRSVIVPDGYLWVLDKLRTMCSDGGYVFANRKGRMTTNCFRNRLYRICDKLGIPRRSMHDIRRTYASLLIDSGKVGRKIVETQMGHTDISCTERHYHRDRRSLEEKRRIINGIPEFHTLEKDAI